MDFEVLGEQDAKNNPFHALESYFRNRRRQLQDWEAEPPHRLGVVVLLIAMFESILGWRLLGGNGINRSILTHTLMAASALLLVEVGLARLASEVAGFFNKKGRVGTALTFFNLGLLPLLLVLPFAVAGYAQSRLRPFALIAWFFLLTKTLGNWRESLEVSFELTKFQSALVLYLACAFAVLIIVLAAYIGFLSTLAEVLH